MSIHWKHMSSVYTTLFCFQYSSTHGSNALCIEQTTITMNSINNIPSLAKSNCHFLVICDEGVLFHSTFPHICHIRPLYDMWWYSEEPLTRRFRCSNTHHILKKSLNTSCFIKTSHLTLGLSSHLVSLLKTKQGIGHSFSITRDDHRHPSSILYCFIDTFITQINNIHDSINSSLFLMKIQERTTIELVLKVYRNYSTHSVCIYLPIRSINQNSVLHPSKLNRQTDPSCWTHNLWKRSSFRAVHINIRVFFNPFLKASSFSTSQKWTNPTDKV